MKNILFIVFGILFFENSYAQKNYEKVDQLASAVHASSVADLHAKLTKNLTSDEDKIRAFYVWIGHNIHYDVNESTRSFRTPFKQEPENVLKSGKAVCHGYSALFKVLCDRSGIKCYLVSGFTKLNGRYDEKGHTWNVVYLNDQWFQVDVTWAAGGVNEQGKFINQFSDRYFLVTADEFLKEHYPFDPMWQLKDFPVKLKEYKNRDENQIATKVSEKFIFNDTIILWEQLDSTSRLLTSAQRMNAFNPGNNVIMQELGYALLDCGNNEFEKGNVILNELYPKGKSQSSGNSKIQPGSDLFNSKLDSAEIYLNKAAFYYSEIKLNDANAKAVAQNNIKSARYNLDIIKREKSRYK